MGDVETKENYQKDSRVEDKLRHFSLSRSPVNRCSTVLLFSDCYL